MQTRLRRLSVNSCQKFSKDTLPLLTTSLFCCKHVSSLSTSASAHSLYVSYRWTSSMNSGFIFVSSTLFTVSFVQRRRIPPLLTAETSQYVAYTYIHISCSTCRIPLISIICDHTRGVGGSMVEPTPLKRRDLGSILGWSHDGSPEG